MNKLLGSLFLAVSILFFACEKEASFELPTIPAQGSLQADGGGLCLPKTISGSYVANTVLVPSLNTITVDVVVAAAGSYTIYTDTVNGYSFRGTGSFTAAGAAQVVLKASGTPIMPGTNVFTVFFDSTQCDVAVQVLPAGSGGPAVFTMGGAGGSCVVPLVGGDYVIGTALTSSNTVFLSVNVTTIGAYNITTTTVQGMTFSGSGSLTATGAQTIQLTGTGTPVAPAGVVSFPVTAGSTTCNFGINLLTTLPPMDYFPRTANSNWSYEYDDIADDSLIVIAITPTHSAGGNVYNIFGASDDGISFDTAGYYRKSGNDYYRYTNLAFYIGFDNDYFAEFVFLKDNQPAGFTWTSPSFTGLIGAVSKTIRMKYKVLQKDITKTITTSKGVVNYPNTIVIEEKYEELVGGNWTPLPAFGTYIDYFARGVGRINNETFDGTGALFEKNELRRYQVF
jgi:hypothetical protein